MKTTMMFAVVCAALAGCSPQVPAAAPGGSATPVATTSPAKCSGLASQSDPQGFTTQWAWDWQYRCDKDFCDVCVSSKTSGDVEAVSSCVPCTLYNVGGVYQCEISWDDNGKWTANYAFDTHGTQNLAVSIENHGKTCSTVVDCSNTGNIVCK